ncbi:MAG: RodZ domain-containing protein [Pseudomonadota bacterium]
MSGDITPGYGAMLAEARQAKGLSIQDVADKLKLTARQIEAMEAEDAQRLPAPVYLRGFIRNYARLVELPYERLPAVDSSAVPTETITAHSEEVRFNASPVKRWLLLPLAAFVLFLALVAVLYAWLSQGEEAYVEHPPAEVAQSPVTQSPVDQPAPTPLTLVPGTVPDGAAVPGPSTAPGLDSTIPSPALPPVPTAAPVVPAVPPLPSAPVPPPAQASVPAVKPDPGHVVQLVADQTDAWIEVVSGDDKRYTRLLRVGEQLTLRGAAPFRLVVGNAATVRLTYDGRPIDLKPYTGDKVARLTLE